jgi:hypothetical protein
MSCSHGCALTLATAGATSFFSASVDSAWDIWFSTQARSNLGVLTGFTNVLVGAAGSSGLAAAVDTGIGAAMDRVVILCGSCSVMTSSLHHYCQNGQQR